MYNFRDTTSDWHFHEEWLPTVAMNFDGGFIEHIVPGYRTLTVSGREMLGVELTAEDVLNGCIVTEERTPARAFERNYERPAATHPEREDYAVQWYNRFKDLKASQGTGEAGLAHLESLLGVRIGNGQCYALSAEFSGVLGGCGLGAGTKYGLSHVIGDTVCASNIGSSYDWGAVGWKVIFNPSYDQLVVGSIINWKAGGQVEGWYADGYYGHTGVIRGLDNGRIQTYEQNVTGTAAGMVCTKQDRGYYGSIASICIPPK